MSTKIIGWGILICGTAALGLWASYVDAVRIETLVREEAARQLQQLGAGDALSLAVSGRDITVSGLAENKGGAAAVLASLDQTKGRRVLRADLMDLPIANPYTLAVTKDAGLAATGFVPSSAMRARLTSAMGIPATALELAAGAPPDWEQTAEAGLAALAQLDSGTLRLEGQTVILQGFAKSPQQADAASAAVASVAFLIKDIALLDDGLPIAYTLSYSAPDGGTVRGKLPKGVSLGRLATALGLPKIAGEVKTAQGGDTGDISFLTAWAAVLPQIETLAADISPDARRVQARLALGADAAAVSAALATGGFAVSVEETIPPQPQPAPKGEPEGEPETSPKPEVSLPAQSAMGFEITPAGCQEATNALLSETKIIFLPNLDTLEETATGVLDSLAAIARDCANGQLRAEIGGHTDTSGDNAENLALSARRAETVRTALITAGVPASQLSAKGYGDAQPIADNATKEGRNQNRRTTVIWSQ